MKRIGCVLLLAVSVSAATTVVKTHAGRLEGIANADGTVTSFKGVPYAAAPVGALRWKAPQGVAHWSGVRRADHFGASCMQGPNNEFGPWTKEFLYVTPVSEDCLYLNVWTPKAGVAAAKLPVLFFIHGGGFSSGSGDVPVYDGEALAKTGMVVVTINYRVGVFGFLAHPELTAEGKQGSSGNYGLLDQIAALEWVKRNVGEFGGDAGRVAIAGQSAGAMSTADLLASPPAKGLFHAVIADSGIGGRGVPMKTLAEAEKAGVEFAQKHNASSIEALRAMAAKDLMPANPMDAMRFAPNVDGMVVSGVPVDVTANAGIDVPVITGFQANDFRLGPGVHTVEEFQTRSRKAFGPMADEFLKLYPASNETQLKEAETASGEDRLKAGMYFWARERAKAHKSAVYVYFFDRAIPWPAHPEFGAFHTGEIPYTFGNLGKLDRPWEAVDWKISKMMMGYWKNMAGAGDPNGEGLPQWERVDAASGKPEVMRLGAECGPIAASSDAARLDFWKRYFESPESKGSGPF